MGDIGGIAQAGASIANAGIQAGAITSAAQTQADATKYAVDATSKSAANSLAFNQGVYNTTQTNEQPYMAAGAAGANALEKGITDGSLTAGYSGGPFSFSGVNQANDPAYQFDLQQGESAIQNSAAAAGGLVSGGALKDLDSYATGTASNQYQQSYTNALAAYEQAYSQFETQQSNTFNRDSSVAGLGQNSVTGTATSGNAAAGTNAAVNTATANTVSGLTTAGANAAGASTLALGNAFSGATNGIANAFAQNSGSSYSPNNSNQYGAVSNLTNNVQTVTPDQWANY